MSYLEQLPRGIRQEILRYLLLADRVRQLPNHLLVEHYAFQVNMLSVDRAINPEAAAVLYQENAWIKINWDFKEADKSMRNHEVPFFLVKDKFAQHVVEVAIKFDPVNVAMPTSMKLKKPLAFLLHLCDLPKYTRLLRLMDLVNHMCYQIHFKLHKPHHAAASLTILGQSDILSAFESVRGTGVIQTVDFIGPFDPTIVKRVKLAMTQKVSWVRGAAWEIYEIAHSMKRMGDWAFRLRNADMAMAKYQDMETFILGAINKNDMVKRCDAAFDKAVAEICITTYIDISLLSLTDFALAELGKAGYEAVVGTKSRINAAHNPAPNGNAVVANSVLARFYHLLGGAELGLDHPIKAGKAFVQSYKMVANISTREGHKAARDWAELGKKAKKARLDTLLASLPTEPFAVPDMKAYNTPEVSSEHWVMRELGLEGPIPYADKINAAVAVVLTTKPHPNHHGPGPRTARVGEVKPTILQKHVDKYRAVMKKYGRLMCWVRLNASEIGEETVLDQPGYMEAMRNGMNGGCNPQ
jgi:hypothetical protein